ncbi:hypothetical protein ACFFJY_13695 [Fictibacillus aquaticus]|nr:hypothetical protein [Fictibacillus aquaticus]
MKKMKYITYSFIVAVVITYFSRKSSAGADMAELHNQLFYLKNILSMIH